jgi:hypothetical protein
LSDRAYAGSAQSVARRGAIALLASGSPSTPCGDKRPGGSDFAVKPVDKDALLAKVRACLDAVSLRA